jgi:hypothetical protein
MAMDGHMSVRNLILASAGALLVLVATMAPSARAADALKAYNVVLNETSVSGISSGAFMAVQFGVANSAVVRGVGATAGGRISVPETMLRAAST